jgi:hypothetical protein
MTLDNFNALDVTSQVDYTLRYGTRIGERTCDDRRMLLFRLDNFFVEIVHETVSRDIIKIGGFEHEILLQPYLDQIDLSGLLTG